MLLFPVDKVPRCLALVGSLVDRRGAVNRKCKNCTRQVPALTESRHSILRVRGRFTQRNASRRDSRFSAIGHQCPERRNGLAFGGTPGRIARGVEGGGDATLARKSWVA